MSKAFIIVLLTLISNLVFSQTTFNISFDRTIDTVQNQTDWAYFSAVLVNPSTIDSVDIKTTILTKNVPFGWSIYLCPPNGCLTFIDTTTSLSIASLQVDTFLVKVWTDVMAIGNGDFTMRFENELDSTDFVDTVLYVRYVPVAVGIEENQTKTNYLSQNYPNPFNQNTIINYKLQTMGGILIISDIYGRKIKEYSLAEKEGKIIVNENFSSGIYFYSLTQQSKIVETRKFIVQRSVKNKP